MVKGTFATVAIALGNALRPLGEVIATPRAFESFAAQLGWTASEIPAPIQDLVVPLGDLVAALETAAQGDPTELAILELASTVADLVQAVRAIASAPDTAFDPTLLADGFKDEFPSQLLGSLLIRFMRRERGIPASILGLLGVLRVRYAPRAGNRPSFMRETLDLATLAASLRDPGTMFREAFGWGTDEPNFQPLFDLLDDFFTGIEVYVERSEVSGDLVEELGPLDDLDRFRQHTALRLVFFERQRTTGILEGGLELTQIPGNATDAPGLALMPYFTGLLGIPMQLGAGMTVTIDADFDVDGGVGLVLRPERPLDVVVGFADGGSGMAAEGGASVTVENEPSGEPVTFFGEPGKTRLELATVSGVFGVRVRAAGARDVRAELKLQGGRVVVVPDDLDGLLGRLLPSDGLSARFEFAVGLSSEDGLYFPGGTGLHVALPIRRGPIDDLTLELRPVGDALSLDARANLGFSIGPVALAVAEVGLGLDLSFPSDGANLGILDLDVAFRPPQGAGLRIDSGPVKGAGFLAFEPATSRYSGSAAIEIATVKVSGFGVVETFPGSATPHYSFCVAISSEFGAVPLGLGFTLDGVGGLIGLHRRVDVDAMRSALRGPGLGDIFFAANPLTQAARLLGDLARYFPAAEGRYVFGPAVKLGWGTPTVVEGTVALLLEVPAPVRLVLLGNVRTALPTKEQPIIILNVDVVGEVDFARKTAAIDAALRDSKVAGFPITGDMALRMAWGDPPSFVLSVGGFHSDFRAPPGFPELRRIRIPIGSGQPAP
jgi:hypothetical protein